MHEFSVGWPAPAKLNLMLHITGQREDGYHLLQTVFQFIDLCDELDFRVTERPDICLLSTLGDVAPESNLIMRAAKLLQRESGAEFGVEVVLRKKLPMGGGLGGGSSDAATTLIALNLLWGLDYSLEHLAQLGLQLGADVPVFVRGVNSWAEGVGEKLVPVDLPCPWYLVVRPQESISTAELFARSDLTRNCPPITIAAFEAGCGENVFFPVVKKAFPVVAAIADRLAAFGEVKLTGTGACLFLEFEDESSARSVESQLPKGWERFVVPGLSRSPLMQRLEEEIIGLSRGV